MAYKTKTPLLRDYPDVLDIELVSAILNVSTKTCYKLLREGKVAYLKVGRAYRIPKANVVQYLNSACQSLKI